MGPDTRSEIQTDQGKAALRSLFELKDVPKTGATELYFGPSAPAGKEKRWIKTNPGRAFIQERPNCAVGLTLRRRRSFGW